MDRISIVILNYSDYLIILSPTDEVRSYECLDSVVVVDNHSFDDSRRHLQPPSDSGKARAIRVKQNGGYGLGDQKGINYTVDRLEAEYVVIANPDTHVAQRCICRVRDMLGKTWGAVAASARVRSPQGGELFSCWTFPPLRKGLLDVGLATRRLFKAVLSMPFHRLAYVGNEDCRLVNVALGSSFILKTDVFTPGETKEVFDKHIFLYYEEKVLRQKFRKMRLKTILVTDESYVHAHSVSIDKSFRRIMDKQGLLHRNKSCYYGEYPGIGPAGTVTARVALGTVLAEVWFLTMVCGMWW